LLLQLQFPLARTNVRFMRRLALLSLIALAACDREPPPLPQISADIHRDSITAWQASRQRAIYGPTGWATVLGLWWVEPGEITIGSDSSNRVILPRDHAPPRVGSVFITNDSTWFVAAKGVPATVDSIPFTTVRLHSDLEPKYTLLRSGPLMIYYLVREDRGVWKHALRIKDTASVAREGAPPLKYFPTDIKWRVQASFVTPPKPDSLNIISVLGTETRMAHEGDVHFAIDGARYSLQIIREPEDHGQNLFLMFTDSTSRKESYPATRYVWVAPPDSLGRVIIDFNKAFNPPCAFTKFATCPFPPKGNHVPIRVEGGEWNPHYGEMATKTQ
jgi:uncharacterized protein (DUF1684 family)